MIAKVEVNRKTVLEFIQKIKDFEVNCNNNASLIKAYYDELIDFTNKLIQKTSKALDNIQKVIFNANKKYQLLEKELKKLESQLRQTPPTITETHYDSEGNAHTTTTSNPEYVQLQKKIGEVRNKINKVQSIINRSNHLLFQIQNEYNNLQNCIKEFTSLEFESLNTFKKINENNGNATKKLEKIVHILEGYLEVSINLR